jgi:hypothetical protein
VAQYCAADALDERKASIANSGVSLYVAAFENRKMSITATVEAGKIILPADIPWPSGTIVRIEPVEAQPPTLWETLKEFDGIATDLPADLAANLDHYRHGRARS